MFSPLVLQTEDILNISTDFVSPLAPASQASTVSTNLTTQIVEDSLPKAQTPLMMSTAKRPRTYNTMFEISSSPIASPPAKRKAVEDEPTLSLMKKKAKRSMDLAMSQKPSMSKQPIEEAAPETDEDMERESSDGPSEDSDEYQPSQTKKAATLGTKLATKGKLQAVFNSIVADNKLTHTGKVAKKELAKQSNCPTAKKTSVGGKDKTYSKPAVKADCSKKGLAEAIARQTDLDDSDSSSEDGITAALSRKNRMQVSSRIAGNKSVSKQSAITEDKKPAKTSKTTIHESYPDKLSHDRTRGVSKAASVVLHEDFGGHIHSSPPTDIVKEDVRNQALPSVDRRHLEEATIVQFGKDGPRHQVQGQSNQSHKRSHDLHSETVQKTSKSTQAPAVKPSSRLQKSRPKLVEDKGVRQVNDGNIAHDDEDALAGFGMRLSQRSDKSSSQARPVACSDTAVIPSKITGPSGQRAEVDVTMASHRNEEALREPTSSQIAMPPPKHALQPVRMVKANEAHKSDSEGSRHKRGSKRRSDDKLMTTGARSESRSHKSQQHKSTASADIHRGSSPKHPAVDDSGYISAAKSVAAPIHEVQKRKVTTTTVVSDQGSPMLAQLNHATIEAVIERQPPHHIAEAQDASDEESSMPGLHAKGHRAGSGLEAEDTLDADCKGALGHVSTRVQKSSELAAEVASSKSGKLASPNGPKSMEAILDWRSNLQAHQRCLFDRLVNDAEALVSYLVRREEVIQDLVDDYRNRGQDLIKYMELMHAKEYEQYCNERDACRARALE